MIFIRGIVSIKRITRFTLKQLKLFTGDKHAVIGLPMRLTVSLIIGALVLSFILGYILNPCLFPSKMVVTVNPMVNVIPSGSDQKVFSITVHVAEVNGAPIGNANIIISGLGGTGSNSTNPHGETVVELTAKLEKGVNEGYLDIFVEAPCHETFSQNNMIKVVRGT